MEWNSRHKTTAHGGSFRSIIQFYISTDNFMKTMCVQHTSTMVDDCSLQLQLQWTYNGQLHLQWTVRRRDTLS